MAGFLDDVADTGLIGGLAQAGQGFVQGYSHAQDRKQKQVEFEAKMRAAKEANQLRMQEHRLDMEMRNDTMKAMAGMKPSKAQEAVDTTFGKDYGDYAAGGGRASVDKNLGLLGEAIQDLSGPDEISGGATNSIPLLNSDAAQDVINPKQAAVRDKIRSAVQGTLKQVLGGQYTEREGQAIFNRAYNPRLSDDENIKRAKAELSSLSAMAGDKDNAARFYEQNGTLRGFKPVTKGRGKGLMGSGAPAGGGKPQTVIQNGVTYTLNPSTGEYE